MANATLNPAEITLTLSLEEAQFIHALTERVSGCPRNSARKYADSVNSALSNVVDSFHKKDLKFSSEYSVHMRDFDSQ